MIRILLVDDQPLVRAGLRSIISADDGLVVVGEGGDGDEVPALIERSVPDVVVMDVRMPGTDGVEATRQIQRLPNRPPVLVLTTFDGDEVLSAVLRAGASGFLLKDARGEDVLGAIRAVARGDGWLDPAVTARVLVTYRGDASAGTTEDPRLARLTERESEVLRQVGRGFSNHEIASLLFVSEVTIKTHINHIFDKLELRDRAGAIVFAFDQGLVAPER